MNTQITHPTGEWLGQRPATAITEKPATAIAKRSATTFSPVTIAHVVDAYRRYPGEVVTFFTRIEVRETMADVTLRVALPHRLVLLDYRPPPQRQGDTPYIEVVPSDGAGDDSHEVVWTLAGKLSPGLYEYEIQARIAPTPYDVAVSSRAVVTCGAEIASMESVTFTVHAKGRYLRYLPEIYEGDDLMGRFLMLFESFWGPLETQIDNVYGYFNPEMTPLDFLHWLASWFDLTLNERLPEERQRQLVREAIPLYRRRGTRQGLLRYLEIYTGGEVHILEQRAENFRLGTGARLGPGIALGRDNYPHTFTVMLRLPEEDTRNPAWIADICALIEAEKPAHTAYTLNVEAFVPSAD